MHTWSKTIIIYQRHTLPLLPVMYSAQTWTWKCCVLIPRLYLSISWTITHRTEWLCLCVKGTRLLQHACNVHVAPVVTCNVHITRLHQMRMTFTPLLHYDMIHLFLYTSSAHTKWSTGRKFIRLVSFDGADNTLKLGNWYVQRAKT